jgi:anti-anti-sigma factor
MNIETKRKDGIPIIYPDGRLDAFGSIKFEEEVELAISEEDSYLVINMEKVQYLSSGGIRVLIAAQKKLTKRGGTVILSGVPKYSFQVLSMAGVDTLFSIFEVEEDALQHSKIHEKISNSRVNWKDLPCYRESGAVFRIFTATDKSASLKIAGNLMKVLHATLEVDDIKLRYFSDTEYSIGLGALGGSLDDCLGLFGEMITIGGTMVWLPTDGNDTPDFLIPQRDTGGVVIYTGLNLALDGQFNDIVLIQAGEKPSVSISDIYSALFKIAAERKLPERSLIAVSIIADIDALFSSGVKVSPIKKNAPAAGMIMDRDNVGHWMNINSVPKFKGETMVGFGIGLNLGDELSGFDKKYLDNIFYINPANVGSNTMMLHNHGVVFEHMKWNDTPDIDSEIKQIVNKGRFIDMRHLLDHTRVIRALVGVSYISAIAGE